MSAPKKKTPPSPKVPKGEAAARRAFEAGAKPDDSSPKLKKKGR